MKYTGQRVPGLKNDSIVKKMAKYFHKCPGMTNFGWEMTDGRLPF